MPLLRGGDRKSPRSLFWHYPHYHGSGWTPGAAVRDGRWKLIEFWEYNEVELYDLALDEREEENLAAENPDKVKELQEKLTAWRKDIGAVKPEPNPEFPGE